MNDTLATESAPATRDEESVLAESRTKKARRSETLYLLLVDARRDAKDYVENYTAGRGAE